jgi:hypothetical protein
MMTLACPEECAYLRDARQTTADRLIEQLMVHLLEQGKDGLLTEARRVSPLIPLIEGAVIGVQRQRYRDLTDKEVSEAIENALKTYETLDRGVIYEHRSESLRVQAVIEAVLQGIARVKEELQHKRVLVKTGDWLSCLRLVRELVAMLSSDADEQAYIRTATLFQPYPQRESKLIVVPG